MNPFYEVTNSMKYCQEMISHFALTKVRWIVPGGETFQESVINGVKNLEELLGKETSLDDHVFIQYGGAPFTSQKIVNLTGWIVTNT